jgi:hypothetical protein
MMILENIIPENTWAAIKNYITNAITTKTKVDVSNSATGSTSVTVNGVSGRAIFTNSILPNGISTFTIQNSEAANYSSIFLSLKYDIASNGNPILVYYSLSGTNISIKIYNLTDLNSTNDSIIVDFILMG